MKLNFLFSFFYDCCLTILSLLILPKLLYMRFVHGKYKETLSKRLGYGFPDIAKKGRKLIWIHVVSVGETRAMIPLIKAIRSDYPDAILIISSITETGHAEAKRSIPFADHHVYLPFDFSWIVRPIVAQCKPDLVIVCESDFWYHFLTEAKKQGAHLALVNGKVSEKSFKRYGYFSWFTRHLFNPFDLLCVQNGTYKKRFEKLGLPAEKIHVTGNLKFDDRALFLNPEQLKVWKEKLGIHGETPILTVGSTHEDEEKMIIDLLPPLWITFPNLKVLLVPRHPERFNVVAGLLQKHGIPFQRYTDKGFLHAPLVLVDAMGQLRNCYQVSTLAIVAGSFVSHIGGHNILEPLWYGVPVIFGPYMHAQQDLVSLVSEYEAGIQIPAAQLEPLITHFIQDKAYSTQLGENGKRLLDSVQGSTERTWKIIRHLL